MHIFFTLLNWQILRYAGNKRWQSDSFAENLFVCGLVCGQLSVRKGRRWCYWWNYEYKGKVSAAYSWHILCILLFKTMRKHEHAVMQLGVKLHHMKDTETGSGISCRNFALMFKYSSLTPSSSISCRQLSTYQSTNEKILCQRQGEEKSTKFNRGKQFSDNADTHRTMTRCF